MKNLFLLSLFAVSAIFLFSGCLEKAEITNFEECAAEGNPILESYPRMCIYDGRSFVEEIDEPVLGSSCGTVTPGYNDECCERQNNETIKPDCAGKWKYSFDTDSCYFSCEI